MSVKQRRGLYVPTCDCCGKILTPASFYWDAVAIIREAGWQRFREDGHWVDLCLECDGEW